MRRWSHHPIVYVNPAFLLLTGYTEQEVIGQTTSILTGPDTDRASMEKLAMALQDGWACRVRVAALPQETALHFGVTSRCPP